MRKLFYNRIAPISVILFQLGPLGALFAQGNWISYTNENTILVDNKINDILIVDGVKWIGTSWGLYTYNNSTWVDYSEYLPNPQVRSLTLDNNGILYVGTLNGIAVYDGADWFTVTPDEDDSDLPGHINDIVFNSLNIGYIGTIDGLYKLENETISLVLDSSSLEPTFINVRCLAMKGDSLCIGTINGGLAYYYNDSISWYNASNGLIDNTATDLLVSNENVWVTAPYGGLITHLNTGSFLVFNTGYFDNWPSNSLNCIIEDEGLYYIGTNEAGMFSLNYEGGVQNTTVYNTSNSGLINDDVLCIEKEDNGYWIGTEGGLTYWSETLVIEAFNAAPVFRFDGTNLSIDKPSDIVVFSIDGKKILRENNSNNLKLNGLSQGFYIISINNERFIIQKY